MSRKWFVAWMISLFVAGVRPALAEGTHVDPVILEAAQALYNEAAQLLKEGKFVAACVKLERVVELVPSGVGGHAKLAECYENVGRLGSAWEHYTTAETQAYRNGQVPRANQFGEKANDVATRVARLTLVVPKELEGMDGLTVLIDGKPQAKTLWNTAQPVDNGNHVIEVKAPGRQTVTKPVVILSSGFYLNVGVVPGRIIFPEPPPLPPVRPWQKPLGWTTVAMGSASLITSGILSGMAVNKANASNVDGHCTKVYEPKEEVRCDGLGKPLRDEANDFAHGATATVVAGGVLAAGGLILVLTAPKSNKDASKKTGALSFSTTISPMGIGLQGAW